MTSTLIAVVGATAFALSMVASLPQLISLWRHPDRSSGVSIWAWAFSCSNEAAWVLWGIRHDQIALIGASVVPLVLTLAIIVRLATQRGRWHPLGLPPATSAVLLVAPVAVAPFAVAGQVLPSASQWLRARRGDRSGISSGTWALETLVSLSWLAYGVLHADWVVMAPEIVVIPLCASLWWMSRRSRATNDWSEALTPST